MTAGKPLYAGGVWEQTDKSTALNPHAIQWVRLVRETHSQGSAKGIWHWGMKGLNTVKGLWKNRAPV